MLKNFLVILLFPFLVNGQSAFISGDATICDNGISAELVVSFTGTAPFTFNWSGPSSYSNNIQNISNQYFKFYNSSKMLFSFL